MEVFTLTNKNGMTVRITNYGGRIVSFLVPDRNGKLQDVVLGFDKMEDYLRENHLTDFGAAIGRYANRLGDGKITVVGKTYQLPQNNGRHCLHGGPTGWQYQLFEVERHTANTLILTLVSPDGDNNFPGEVRVRLTYTVTEDNQLDIRYSATTDAPTVINMTNHSYFNLNGGGSVLGHRLQLFAERFAENDGGCLPTGTLLKVEGTPFDFRTEKEIGADIGAEDEQLKRAGGYDHNYVLCGAKAAVLYSPETGIEMTVETDLPGMQLYTGNFLTERKGKGGSRIDKRYAACFETQLYPNAMNCYGFPSPVLRAGKHLHSETSYAFRVR
jgi:aldose 1-epimerase